jgi:hypothetical protein
MTIASDRIESFLVRHRGETISRSEKVIVSQFGIRRLTETERCGDQPLMVDQKRHRDPHPCQGALNKVRREAKCLGMRDALFKLGDAPSTLRNMAVHQVQVCVGVGHCSNAEGYGQRTERQIHVDRTDCSRNRDNGYDTYPSRTLVLVQHAGALRDVALNLHSNRGQELCDGAHDVAREAAADRVMVRPQQAQTGPAPWAFENGGQAGAR